jgi:two-component system, cell cycle sensor histidine kinase and response regulator CckA
MWTSHDRYGQDQILPSHPEMKYLFMSGYTASIIATHGVLDEGTFFIQKPFTLATLSAKIKEVLNQIPD